MRRIGIPLFLISILLLVIPRVAAAAAATSFVSISTTSTASNETCENPSISADGRYVAFASRSTDLVSEDTNSAEDIFVRDTVSNATTLVSVSSSGVQGNGDCKHPSISPDGRFVAYESSASNLVTGDTNSVADVFVYDRTSETTVRVSVSTTGTQVNGASTYPSISVDGKAVAFQSTASNLVTGDTNGQTDVFVRDITSSTTERVSISGSDAQGTFGASSRASISYTGRYVAFQSAATNLVEDDTNAVADIFVRDRTSGTTVRVSLSDSEAQAIGGDSITPSISSDGRFVAFASMATNLVSNDANALQDVFVRDRQEDDTTIASVSSSGALSSAGSSENPSISADGAYVAFHSGGTNLVPDDTNGAIDVFIHNVSTGDTELVSQSTDGTLGTNGNSIRPSISANGRYVAFSSAATGLFSIADLSNAFPQIYLRDRGSSIGGTDHLALTITVPTTASTFTTSSQSITVGGTASDDVGVELVTWANSRGGSGTATGTTSWSASGIALQTGANVITVTGKNFAGDTTSKTLTVTYTAAVPVVTIKLPTVRRSFQTALSSILVSGTASDAEGITKVEWTNLRGGSGTATGTTAWSVSDVALEPGRNVIKVTATNGVGGTADSHIIVFSSSAEQKVRLAGTASDGSVWYTGDLSSWKRIPGKLAHLAIGDFNADGLYDVAGIASDGSVWVTTNESTWTKVPGKLSSIIAADFNADGKSDLAGLSSDGKVWYTTDLITFHNVPGLLSVLIAGDFAGTGNDRLAGLASDHSIWLSTNLTSLQRVPGKLASIVAADLNGTHIDGLAGLASDSTIWYSATLPTLKQIAGRLATLTVGDFNKDGFDDLAGTASDNTVWFTTSLAGWNKIPQLRKHIVASDLDGDEFDDLAGLAADNKTSYTTDLQTWTNIPGALSTLSAPAR